MSQLHKNKRKGFTLLEILLVIAAIGILAAIVLVAINPTRQIAQVRDAQRRSDINTIYKALEQYLIDNKDYPEGITGTPKAICNNTVTTNCVNLSILVPTYIAAIPKDPSGLVYEVYKNSDNNRIGVKAPGVELSQSLAVNPISSTPTPTPTPVLGRTSCPTGYILVPGNSLYNTNNFCVAKYEMKAVAISSPTVGLTTPDTVDNGIPTNAIDNIATPTTVTNGRAITSVSSGYPIANISQITATDYCANQNTVSGASLITNAEWMTIARNIEAQNSNWSNNTISNANALNRGHSNSNPSKSLVASTNDLEGCSGYTDGRTCTNQWHVNRRTHTLSNGEIIWDLSGNVWEWTNDTIVELGRPNNSSGNLWQEWTAISNFGTLSYDLTRPSNNTWNSAQNMGQYYKGATIGGPFAFIRGAFYGDNIASGIFTLILYYTPSVENNHRVGFRCVVR